MDFREFATNYLNPFFLMYRAVLFAAAFFIWFFSVPMFTSSATSDDLLTILVMAVAIGAGLYSVLRYHPYMLYLVAPIALIVTGLSIRGAGVVADGVLKLPMAMWWAAALLLVFNGFRSWGYGVSMHDIGTHVSDKLNDFQK